MPTSTDCWAASRRLEQLWDDIEPWGRGPMYFDKVDQPISMCGTYLRQGEGDNLSAYARIGYDGLEGGVWVSTWPGMDHGSV